MTKRTKKSVGTRRRKNRTNYRKKTFRKKNYRNRNRNRKTQRGYRGGEGSDDEEETKEETVANITTGLRNLDVNQGSSSSSDVDNITSGVENLNVIADEEQDECPICGVEYTNEENGPMITTPCGHKFHRNCLCKWCHKGTCPICRTDIKNTTCNQDCKFYLKIEKYSNLFSPQNPASNAIILKLLEEMMDRVNPLRGNISASYSARLESELQIIKDAIKKILRNPNSDLRLVKGPPPRRPTIDMFVYVLESEDPELIDLYLNKFNPDLTDKIISDAKVSITDKNKFAAVIRKMKNPEIRNNFPNIINFDKESADEIFRRGLKGPPSHDMEVIRQAINMPDLNLMDALCLLISEYEEGQDDEDQDDKWFMSEEEKEETKEEHILEDSLRRFKEEIISNPEFDPFELCSTDYTISSSVLYTAIKYNDEKTMYALLENPRLQQGLTNALILDLKRETERKPKQKDLFVKLVEYVKNNKSKFPEITLKSPVFKLLIGGK